MSASDCVYLLSCLIECPFEEFNNIEIEDDDFLEDDNSNISEDEIEKNEKKGIGDIDEDDGLEPNHENLNLKKK